MGVETIVVNLYSTFNSSPVGTPSNHLYSCLVETSI